MKNGCQKPRGRQVEFLKIGDCSISVPVRDPSVMISVNLLRPKNRTRLAVIAAGVVLFVLCLEQRGTAAPPSEEPSLRELLSDLDPRSSKAIESVPRLISTIQNDVVPGVVRRQAAMMLARIGEPASDAIPILIELRDGSTAADPNVRFWATKSLGLFRSTAAEAVPVLSRELADLNIPTSERLLVADVLGQIGTGPAVQALARELLRPRDASQPDETLLLEVAIDAVAQAGPEGVVALPALIRVTEHARPAVRRKACVAIGGLGPRAELSLDPLLTRIVLDDDPAVRDAAAAALARIGPGAVPVLIRLVESNSPELQWRAAHALRQIGPRAETALDALQQATRSTDARVRVECLDAIWGIGKEPKAVADALIVELSNTDRQVRRRASELLINLTPLPAALMQRLKTIAADRSHDAWRAAGYVLRERLRRQQEKEANLQ